VTASPRRFALGVGLTNACNLDCNHCYRSTGSDSLQVDDVLAAVSSLPTRAVNLGTGENGLHPDLPLLVRELSRREVAVTMTTNGYSSEILSDDVLSLFRDVEFSIDYPTESAHDEARGAGNWALIEREMARCRGLGVSVAIVSVLMATNHRALRALAALARARDATLRVNVYQAVRGNALSLGYDQFWEAFADLLGAGELVACGEPIVRAVLGIPRARGAGCGVETVRITPRGAVLPCVYQADDALGLADLQRLGPAIVEHATFRGLDVLPEPCRACPQVETCGGGCPSRRRLRGGLHLPDEYCPFVRGKALPLLRGGGTGGSDVPKASSACTTIVRPRPTA
jgi:radical SAM protein with 4Fe4S-binding SPASM domain